ncbi:MAG: type I DNA topoisomerase, partial [Alphaproteobacteria bacterium]
SYGHVRDLPSKDGSVRPDEDFAMSWAMDGKSSKRVADIVKAMKGAAKLILATDPDREGEAISWHVLEVLGAKGLLKGVEVERVVFNAVTRQAVLAAMAAPRALDTDLVDAYLARRALDYLVGFTLSPVLWRKLPGSRSAGRVQSVVLKMICERELEIEAFDAREYWTIDAALSTTGGDDFTAQLNARDGKKLDKFALPDHDSAHAIAKALTNVELRVASVTAKDAKRNPYAPFTTSTLQQDASHKLGFATNRTMQIAQRLYEGISVGGETVGLITYMRTDGVDIAPEALSACRHEIDKRFGARYLPEKPRLYKAKAKNAQEAHEAIRPTDLSRHPDDLASILDTEQARLYALIWKRTMASQMAAAQLERTTVDIEASGTDGHTYTFRATGQVVRFDGFLKVYQDTGKGDDQRRLPALSEAEALVTRSISPEQHFTMPPPRFTEASLTKNMEELGIGRPSTYAQTLAVLRNREYVRLEKRQFFPEDKGRLVTAFLEKYFGRYVEYDFTADLETQLDRISNGELAWRLVLKEFWNHLDHDVSQISDLRVTEVLDTLNEMLGAHVFPDAGDGGDPRACGVCEDGRLSLKVGRFGAFVGCSNYPECRNTRQLTTTNDDGGANGESSDKVLGVDPETGLEIKLLKGRFGPYLQLGETVKGADKPKRASIPKEYDLGTLTLEQALALLSLPREIGLHPESGKPIVAGIGRYGPFVQLERTYANLDSNAEVFTVGLNRAVALIAEKLAKGSRGPKTLKELGEHPSEGGPVLVLDGRYGPYVKHAKTNATLPSGTDPQTVTMDEAVALIAAKAGKSRPAKKAKSKKAKAKKSKKSTKTTARKSKPAPAK